MGDKNIFSEQVDRYEEWFKKNDLIFQSEIDAIRKVSPVFESGIEIGVGTGIFASRLGIKDGIEPSMEMANKAVMRGINVINAYAEQIPIADGIYKIALMVTVDCFLSDLRLALSEIRRILLDDGVLIIAFIDRDTELGQMYQQNKSSDIFYKDANFHSANEMLNLLSDIGFEVIDKRQTIFSFKNEIQEIRKGTGEGVFAVIKARKIDMI